jgi:hypothetical protein
MNGIFFRYASHGQERWNFRIYRNYGLAIINIFRNNHKYLKSYYSFISGVFGILSLFLSVFPHVLQTVSESLYLIKSIRNAINAILIQPGLFIAF